MSILTRSLPLVSDRDRLAAARYITEKLHAVMERRRRKHWQHYRQLPHGGIVSERIR